MHFCHLKYITHFWYLANIYGNFENCWHPKGSGTFMIKLVACILLWILKKLELDTKKRIKNEICMMATMVFKWLHIVRNPKKVEPYLILIFTNHHVKNIKWSEEFVDQTIDLPIKQWILGCAISELDLYQKQQTNTQANERSSIVTIYAILVTYPLPFGPEFLLWSSWMLGGNSGGLLG